MQSLARDPAQIILARPTSQRSGRRKKMSPKVIDTRRPTVGQLRLPGAPVRQTSVEKGDDDNDEVEFIEPA